MTSLFLGVIAAILWVGAGNEKTDSAQAADVLLALGCAIAAIVLAIV